MCDVASTAVFCGESVECLPGMASKVFCKRFVTIPVASVITGIIVHFMFQIRCMSIHKLLYFSLFSASFCVIFSSSRIATSISILLLFQWQILQGHGENCDIRPVAFCRGGIQNWLPFPSSHTLRARAHRQLNCCGDGGVVVVAQSTRADCN